MYLLKFRRGTKSEWTQKNPVLASGEPGYEWDTGKFKVGDGQTPWRLLEYFVPGVGGPGSDGQFLLDHINDAEPHPIYDDGPSLLLLYQNAKV